MAVKSSIAKVHHIKNDLDAYYLAEQFGQDTCLHRVLHLAVRLGCKCVVQENDVAVDDFDVARASVNEWYRFCTICDF